MFNAVTQETMAIREDISLLDKKVSDLRTLIALRCGFPVSVFCLRTPEGLEMYDCNLLRDYQTELGTPTTCDSTYCSVLGFLDTRCTTGAGVVSKLKPL